MFAKERQMLESLRALKELEASQASPEQIDHWLATYRPLLGDHGATEALLRAGATDRAVRIYETHALGVIAGRRGWAAGIISFVFVAIVLLIRWPSAGALGIWFFAIFAVVGAVFVGTGYRIHAHPESSTIYTQRTVSGMTDMSSGRRGKKRDGVVFMALSLIFFAVALAGDLLISLATGR